MESKLFEIRTNSGNYYAFDVRGRVKFTSRSEARGWTVSPNHGPIQRGVSAVVSDYDNTDSQGYHKSVRTSSVTQVFVHDGDGEQEIEAIRWNGYSWEEAFDVAPATLAGVIIQHIHRQMN